MGIFRGQRMAETAKMIKKKGIFIEYSNMFCWILFIFWYYFLSQWPYAKNAPKGDWQVRKGQGKGDGRGEAGSSAFFVENGASAPAFLFPAKMGNCCAALTFLSFFPPIPPSFSPQLLWHTSTSTDDVLLYSEWVGKNSQQNILGQNGMLRLWGRLAETPVDILKGQPQRGRKMREPKKWHRRGKGIKWPFLKARGIKMLSSFSFSVNVGQKWNGGKSSQMTLLYIFSDAQVGGEMSAWMERMKP